MTKILGIDTGTNSLGWAIVEKEVTGYRLLDRGVNIFEEGVKLEKEREKSRAAERTHYRQLRRQYWRRKVRKIRLLTVLAQHNLCPPLSKEELRLWRLKKIYPMREDFLAWQRTDDNENINPYRFRYICLTQKLDLTDLTQRYVLGRALYHLNQRRGFLSNRKEGTKESDGKVIQGIQDIDHALKEAHCEYLGEYFFQLYEHGKEIRNHYTSRNSHYLREFQAICEKQELDASLVKKLHQAIFFQRPLKSQKHLVGPCKFEPSKARCPISHPLFEDFRMYQLINNIKIQTPADLELRPLTTQERDSIVPLFKKEKVFDFKVIAKKLSGGTNKGFGYYKDKVDYPYKFNYQMDTQVSPSRVNKKLEDIFGEDWLSAVCEVYALAGKKTRTEIMNDIWHVLFSFDDEEKLKEFAADKLQLDEKSAKAFSQIKLPSDYAALSLKAIKKILFFMKDYGLRYDQAVMLGNLSAVLPKYVWNLKETRNAAIERIIDKLNSYESSVDARNQETFLKDYLKEQYHLDDNTVGKLWHHSDLDTYPRAGVNDDGIPQLGSPRINSLKNPMAMRSLFRIKKVVNLLLRQGKIDAETKVHIELGRDLNDANRRKALQQWQRENEKDNKLAAKEIEAFYKEHWGIHNHEASPDEILKYRLWDEQKHNDLYGSRGVICMEDFLSNDPVYDIEHTIPRSRGGDSTMENLTLCNSRYNREVKKTKLPSELPDHEVILQCIGPWKAKYEEFDKEYRRLKRSTDATKKVKDNRIQRRHLAKIKRDYWKGKYERFTMTEVPEGFARRQGHDNSVVARYARLYLKSLFKQVYIVKGVATSDFRKIWGLQDEYVKKSRDNHAHHCVDAVTIACIGKAEYDKLAQYYHSEEEHKWYGVRRMDFKKPWATFTEDMKHLQDELIIAHHNRDLLPKQTRKTIRNKDGKILRDTNGDPIYQTGDTARGALHDGTYYGAIERNGAIHYVVRKELKDLKDSDIDNIVDGEVRRIVREAILLHGNLNKAIEANDVWMNREKQIPIKKVRIFWRNTPLPIKNNRDKSIKEYKQYVYAMSGGNYLVAIYEDIKGNRTFKEVNNLYAAEFSKCSARNNFLDKDIIPYEDEKGNKLIYKLRQNQMVLIYDVDPNEIWELDKSNLQKRLYKIIGLSLADGRMVLLHHQCAVPVSKIKQNSYSFDGKLSAKMRITFNKFKGLLEGVDFEINDLGEIKRLI